MKAHKFLSLVLALGMAYGVAQAQTVGETATFNVNGQSVTGQVTAVNNGIVTVTSGAKTYVLTPVVDAAGKTVGYTMTVNGVAVVGTGTAAAGTGAAAVGAAAGGVSIGTVALGALVVGVVAAAANNNTGGTVGTTGTTVITP